jgi:hypothetical protein
MRYSIFDGGAVLASYEHEGDAINALVALAAAQPARTAELVFVAAFDDRGRRLGAPVLGSLPLRRIAALPGFGTGARRSHRLRLGGMCDEPAGIVV